MIKNEPKYYYDKKSLSYKTIKSKDLWFFVIVKHIMTSLIISSVITILLFSFIDSPKEKKLKREINNLELQYTSILEKMNHAEIVLDDIQKRDDNIYRMIFGVDPIDETIRRAGFGVLPRLLERARLVRFPHPRRRIRQTAAVRSRARTR